MKISVLVLARRRSRFLATYLYNFLTKTKDLENTELLVMASENDDWNEDVFNYYKDFPNIKFFFEDRKLGRAGRHIFFNELAEKASGDWILHTCDDQRFIMDGWDNYLREMIVAGGIDSNKVHMILPKFDNIGHVDHMISRGYLNAAGRVGGYGNIDSWINGVRDSLPPDRVHFTPDELMHDFTHHPEIYTPEYLISDISVGKRFPKWNSPEVKQDLLQEIAKVQEAIQNGL